MVFVGIIVVAVVLLGYFGYRSLTARTVDSPETLSPETKAKIDAAYGGRGGNSQPPNSR